MKKITLILISLLALSAHAAPLKQTTVGYSFVLLDKAQYHAIELGTSVVALLSKGAVKAYTGVEVSVPLFFDSNGSYIQEADNKGSGFGVGLQVPLILGVDINGVYVQAMGGYNLDWLNNTMKLAPKTETTTLVNSGKTKTISQGFIYGVGAGLNLSNNFSVGIRYIMGSMNNRVETDPSAAAISGTYKTNYKKIMALVGYSW